MRDVSDGGGMPHGEEHEVLATLAVVKHGEGHGLADPDVALSDTVSLMIAGERQLSPGFGR